MKNNPPIAPQLKRLVLSRVQTVMEALQMPFVPKAKLDDLVGLVLGATNDGRAYVGPNTWSPVHEEDFGDMAEGRATEETVPQYYVVAREELTKYLDADEVRTIPPGGKDVLPVFVKDQGVYGALELPIAEDVRRYLDRRRGSGGSEA